MPSSLACKLADEQSLKNNQTAPSNQRKSNMRGGKRAGAGRKPGQRNKLTKERLARVEAVSKAIEAFLPEAFHGDAHAFLVAVYKDPAHPIDLRVDAAKAAVRYEKPALTAIDHSGEIATSYVARLPPVAQSVDEWRNQHGLNGTH
jgi:hypothetical protein